MPRSSPRSRSRTRPKRSTPRHDSAELRSHCPINFVAETFGDKWTLLVIRDLMFKGKRHFSEFRASEEGIASNILADRLQKLEACGVVEKRPDPAHRSKLIYELTRKGRDLMPVMLEITAWSARYDARTNTPKSFLAAIERDRDGLEKGLLAALDAGQKVGP